MSGKNQIVDCVMSTCLIKLHYIVFRKLKSKFSKTMLYMYAKAGIVKRFLSLPSKFQQLQRHFQICSICANQPSHTEMYLLLFLEIMEKHTHRAANNLLIGSSANFFHLLQAYKIFCFPLHFFKDIAGVRINISFDGIKNNLSHCHLTKNIFASKFLLWKVRCVLIYKVILSFSYDVARADCLTMRIL